MTIRELLVGTMLAPALLPGQQKTQFTVHNYPDNHLSISIPAEWVAIPRVELEQMSARVREAAPNAKPQPYNYGFQSSATAKYPRVLIQVKTSGRWAETVFAQLPKISTGEIQRQVQASSPEFAALNIEIGKLTYDPAKRIAWLRMQFTGEDGEMQALSGLHPTKAGSIQVHGYSFGLEMEKYGPLFSEIISSVKIDDEWKYRDRSGLAAALGRIFDFGSSGGRARLGDSPQC